MLLCYFIVAPLGLAQAQEKPGCEGAALHNPQGSYSGSFSNQPFTWAQNAAQWICVLVFSGSTQNYALTQWYDAAAICDGTTCTVTPGSNFASGDYWWWLNTYSDACGFQMQPGGNVLQFTVTAACTDPILAEPTGAGSTINPTFKWSKSSEQWINLQVYTEASAGISFSQWFDASQICNDTNCTVQPNKQFSLGKHWWWVDTYSDACGFQMQPGGAVLEFTVQSCTNMALTLTEPVQGTSRTSTPSFTWQKNSAFDYYQLNTFSISTGTKSFSQGFDASQICNGTSCTVTIPGQTPLPEGDTYWWLNASSPACGWQDQPGGNLGYFQVAPASAKDITSFVLRAADNPGLSTDMVGAIAGDTVKLLVPSGANMAALVPTITTIAGSSINPPSGSAQAFTDNVSKTYTVTASDGSAKNYAVTVTVMTVTLTDPLEGALRTQTPSFTWQKSSYFDYYQLNTFSISTSTKSFSQLFDASQICNDTSCTVTIPNETPLPEGATYWWLNASGPVCGWQNQPGGNLGYFIVDPASATAKDITSFVFRAANNPGLSSDITGTVGTNTVDLTVPYGTSLSALVPTITMTGSSVNPASGLAQPFTSGVGKIYTVTAADSSTKVYTVTVHVALNPAKDITSFVFRAANNPGLSSDITGTVGTNTVDLTVPYGTSLSALVPTITMTGSSVNPASGVAQAFTSGVTKTYTVTAADSTTKVYTVTVYAALNPAKDITSFVFLKANNAGLASDVPGVFGTNTIALTVPYGASLAGLIPTITITGATVSPASGVAQTFTSGVGKTYTVTAADGTTKTYTVTVTVDASNTDKNITSFIFRTFDNPGLTADVIGTIGTTTVALTVPYGTNLSALVPTITITGASISPASGVAQAFTSGAGKTYTVTQVKTTGSGKTKDYTVTVTVAPNPAKDITAFSFTAAANAGKLIDDAIGTINGATIAVTVPPLTNVTALVATFTTTGASVKVGNTTQTSGTTPNNFTNPVTYRVTAADGSTKDYTVTVTVQTQQFAWVQETNSGIRQWYALASSADGMKLAGAAYNDYIYTSTNGGATWTAQTNSGQREWYSLASSTDGMRLAAGVKSGYIYTSADGGATWTQRTGAGSHAWYSITSSADGMKLAAGDYGTGYIYTSTDGGATWTQRTASGQRLWASIASSADGMKIFACVQNGYLYTSTDGGATWTENTSRGAQYWWSVTSSSDGMKLAAIAYNGNLCTSSNGGATWTNLENRGWCAISASSDGTKMTAVVDGGYIYLSTDSGVTWIQQTSAGKRSWDTVAMSADGSISVVGDYGAYSGGYIWIGK